LFLNRTNSKLRSDEETSVKTSYVVDAGREETSSANTPEDECGRTEKWVANHPIARGDSHIRETPTAYPR